MSTQFGVSVGRRPVQVEGLQVSVHRVERLGRQLLVRSDEASPAGVVRSGRAGVPAAVPGSGQ